MSAESGETYVPLYVGDYFADTLDFTASEHRALRLLLLDLWMGNPFQDDDAYHARVAGLAADQWIRIRASIVPLVIEASEKIQKKLFALRAYDGKRLPAAEWQIMRAIVLERDNYRCRYCGSTRPPLEGDHIIPLSRGGTNLFDNINAACAYCNRRKAARTLGEWQPDLNPPTFIYRV
jgi:5-methylcytosine-specific restriction endonuclease McrA